MPYGNLDGHSGRNKFPLNPLAANAPMRIARRRRHTFPRSARPISPGNPRPASSITDPNLTTEQYNEMLANVVRTVQPVGM
jgi:hypothetical protein